MSTPPSAVKSVAAPHASWYSRAGTWFLKVGQEIKAVVLKISNEMPAVQHEIDKIAPTAEKISEMLKPGSASFEQHLLDVWGVAANAVKDAGAAASANGISVSLDQSLVNDVKSFLPQVEAYLHPAASASPAPDSAPAPAAAPAITFGQAGK